jgi:hypothetical protein
LQAEGAEHPEGADGVGGKAEGVGPWDHPAVVHSVIGDIEALIAYASSCMPSSVRYWSPLLCPLNHP